MQRPATPWDVDLVKAHFTERAQQATESRANSSVHAPNSAHPGLHCRIALRRTVADITIFSRVYHCFVCWPFNSGVKDRLESSTQARARTAILICFSLSSPARTPLRPPFLSVRRAVALLSTITHCGTHNYRRFT